MFFKRKNYARIGLLLSPTQKIMHTFIIHILIILCNVLLPFKKKQWHSTSLCKTLEKAFNQSLKDSLWHPHKSEAASSVFSS